MSVPKCGRCSGDHVIWECSTPERQPSSCASCGSSSHTVGDNKCEKKIRAKELSKLVNRGLTYAQAAKALDQPAPCINESTNLRITTRKKEEEQIPPKLEKLLEQLEASIVTRINRANSELQSMLDENSARISHVSDLITGLAAKLDDIIRRVEDIEMAQKDQEKATIERSEQNLKTCKPYLLATIGVIKDITKCLGGMLESAAFSKGIKEDRKMYNEDKCELFRVCTRLEKIERSCDTGDDNKNET